MSSLDVRALDREKGDEKAKKGAPPQVKQEFRVFISEKAFDHAVERGGADTTREVGGILVGELLRDEGGPFIVVETALDALHAEEKGAELTFTHATWDHINKELDTKHAGKRVVGWWHTHPGFGVFLSDRDQFIHRSFFNLPFQIALVYDPKSREHGIFTWRDNEPWRSRRYYVGEREHTWDAARVLPSKDKDEKKKEPAKDKDDDDDRRETSSDKGEERAPQLDWVTVAMVGVFAALLGGFIGWWTAGARGAGKNVSAAGDVDLDRARMEGAENLAQQLNMELVGILQQSLSDESSKRPVEDAMAALTEAEKALEPPPGTPANPAIAPQLERLKTAHDRLAEALESRTVAQAMLTQLALVGRRRAELNPAEVARELMKQHHDLGVLYAELAMDVAKTDPRRARRLLETAARIDEPSRARYQAQLNEFDKDAKLAPPAPEPGSVPPTPAPPPAPAPTPAPAKPTTPGGNP